MLDLKRLSRYSSFRLILALAVLLIFGLLLLLLLVLTEAALNVWMMLREMPAWFLGVYGVIILAVSGFGLVLSWRILKGSSGEKKQKKVKDSEIPTLTQQAPNPVPAPPPPPPKQEELVEEIQQAADKGIETDLASVELEELEQRQSKAEIYIALFGAVSVGKSSLIKALLPNAEVEIDPRGGTTQEVKHYHWQDALGRPVVLTDLPGLFEADGLVTELSQEESRRAHMVIYVCDSDLTRDQYQEINALLAEDKPFVLGLNKIDRFSEAEKQQIVLRLREHLHYADQLNIVTLQSGGQEEVTRVYPDGREEVILRDRKPKLEELTQALGQLMGELGPELDEKRNASVLRLSQKKLHQARDSFREEKSAIMVQSYTQKAVLGAMAAFTPGTDLLIQGYLGYKLIQDLCKIYDIPADKIKIEKFIDIARKHVGKKLPLILAIAGNVFKAFPGVGTVTGGLIHAVAYGIIFESLGKSVSQTLATHGDLDTKQAIHRFEESLGEDLEARARKYAKMVINELPARRREKGVPEGD